jgi:hypothetical protein
MHISEALKNAFVHTFSPMGEKGGWRVEKRSISLSGFSCQPAAFFIRSCTKPDNVTKAESHNRQEHSYSRETRMQRVWLCEEKTQLKGRFFMKKICLVLLVLALSVPAIAGVTITAAKGPEVNSVIISYTATEEVRAFALEVTCTDSALVPSLTQRQGRTRTSVPSVDDANYYVTPTNAGFTSLGTPSTTRVWSYGSPIVSATADGCIIEMASLYATNDPCVAHRVAPPLSGVLAKLFVNETGKDGSITVTVTQANAKRGKVVLKGSGASIDPAGLPASVTLTFDCFAVGQVVGGNLVTQDMYNLWVQLNKPSSWCFKGHYMGDANLDCWIDASDIIGDPGFYDSFGSAVGDDNYRPSCDLNNDGYVDASDILGWDDTSGVIYGWNVGEVPAPCTPGVLP